MKKLNVRIILFIFSLLFVMVLGGCEIKSMFEANKVEKEIEEKITTKDAEVGKIKAETSEALKKKILLSYQKILKSAPAIEGEHEELIDASFDYEKNLKLFGNHYELFAIFDINHDNIPELIALSMVNFRWTPVYVYTYVNGEVVLLKDPLDMQAHGTFEQKSTANGAYITYFCEKYHIHNVWRGTNPMGDEVEENHAYELNGNELLAIDCQMEKNVNPIYFYDIAKENTVENVNKMIQ